MTKYRKMPVVIDAFKWTGGHSQTEDPEWIVEAYQSMKVWFVNEGTENVAMRINTLEGVMTAQQGDYIIRGIQGEIYPCKPEIFEATYEKLADVDDLPEIDIKNMSLTIDALQLHADHCLKHNLSLSLLIDMPGFDAPELITNPPENIVKKMDYYHATYDENCNHKYATGIRIIAFALWHH